MPQHDYVLANAAGAAFRSDLNNALAAIVSQNSGATEPAPMFAYMLWPDTTTGILKQRNAANSAWISLMTLSTGVMFANAALAGSGSQAFSASDFIGAIGATAPNTGAFTTLGVSTATYIGTTPTSTTNIGFEMSGGATPGILGYNRNTSAYLPVQLRGLSYSIRPNDAEVALFSSTGLAVTGAISATTTLKSGGYTVSTLPVGSAGMRAYVTDATAPTYLVALAGSGAVVSPAFHNGTTWISA